MLKKPILIFLSLCILFSAKADEGMWIPLLLKNNEADMQSKGLRLSAEDIFSIERSSLKDAIVKFGGGCTGEFVSKEGLLLTNHHCGYGQIQYHSTVEHDYLRHGFWAMNKSEELPCPGLTVTLLDKMEEVTSRVTEGVLQGMTEIEAEKVHVENMKNMIKEAEANTNAKVEIRAFYNGLQYYMFYNTVYEDVRLVGAPPSNIGKFGGDTDNWMWPRHTGDFAIFRVYADADNNPAKYSPANRPYQPKTHLTISVEGIEENDFTFVFGYPGRTNEYLTSYAVKQTVEVENPIRIKARTKRLDIIKAAMDKDPLTRIQYSAKSASIANGWKKWQGENRGIKKMGGIKKKQAFEKTFQDWAYNYEGGKYKDLLADLRAAYADLEPYSVQALYFTEHVMAPEIIRFTAGFQELVNLSADDKATEEEFNKAFDKLKKSIPDFFKNFDINVDKAIFKDLSVIDNSGEEKIRFIDFPDKDFDKYVDEMYAKSIFTDEARLNKALDKITFSNAAKRLQKDPFLDYTRNVYQFYNNMIRPVQKASQTQIDLLQRQYMQAQMEMQTDKNFYPDANSSLRVAYGKIEGYKPSDGVTYRYYTTLSGLIAKEDPNIFDYVVEDKLKELYNTKDYGIYGGKGAFEGEMPLAFIASNHTTGGNSGSPVLNKNGHMVGINFDRTWESTMSDIMYDPEQCRNISLDIRFCLFIIDKFAGAKHLIDEMDIITTSEQNENDEDILEK